MLQRTDVQHITGTHKQFLALFFCGLLLPGGAYAQGQESRDWLTWGGDPSWSSVQLRVP